MDKPTLAEVLAGFTEIPRMFMYDQEIFDQSWEWAIEQGEPEPYFTFDDLPRLAFAARIDGYDGLLLPSNIFMYF